MSVEPVTTEYMRSDYFIDAPLIQTLNTKIATLPNSDAVLVLLKEQAQSYTDQLDFESAIMVYWQMIQTFPSLTDGYIGMVALCQLRQQWSETISIANAYQQQFPERLEAYQWRATAYTVLSKPDLANVEHRKIIQLFPNEATSYQALAKIAQQHYAYKLALDYWDKWFALVEQNEPNHMTYGQALLQMSLAEKAQDFFLHMINQYPTSYISWHGLGLAQRDLGDRVGANASFKQALDYCPEDNPYQVNIVTSAELSFEKTQYQDHIARLLERFPDNSQLLFYWANLPLQEQPFATTVHIQKQRYETLIQKFPDNAFLLNVYGKVLLNADDFEEAEAVFSQAIQQFPHDLDINKGYCLSAHHRQDWATARQRFDDFYTRFPNEPTEFFFYFIDTLYQLEAYDEITHRYRRFNQIRFLEDNNGEAITSLQASLLLKNDRLAEQSMTKITFSDPASDSVLKLPFYPDIASKVIINDPNNDTLFVVFQGSISPALSIYSLEGFGGLEKVQQFQQKYQQFDLETFVKKSPQYNFLLLRDGYNSYYLANFEDYLNLIKDTMAKLGAKRLVVFGVSGGAFASTLYGQYLEADLVFSMMPRTQAFFSQSEQYYYDLQKACHLFNPDYIDIGYVQRKMGGFIPKTYITLCENHAPDKIGTYTLDTHDANLNITYCGGDIHGIMHYLGMENIFIEITRVIELYRQADFDLPIQGDIFSQLAGFKYNSHSSRTTTLDFKTTG